MSRPAPTVRRVLLGGAALGLVALAWLGVRAGQVYWHLTRARLTVASVAANPTDAPSVSREVSGAQRDVDRAVSATNDPLWRLVASLPWVGRSFAFVRDLSGETSGVLHGVLPPALRAEHVLQSEHLVAHGRIDLAALARIGGEIQRALGNLGRSRSRIAAVPTSWVPGPLAAQRGAVLRLVDRAGGPLARADRVLSVAPALLGRDGPRRYFVGVQNEAESRASGGLIGAYAVLRFDRGSITRERIGTDLDLKDAVRPVVDLGPDFAALYDGSFSRLHWPAVGATPHWPDTSRIVMGLWAEQGGGPLDGVIGLDPLSMADLLAATGPVSLHGLTLDSGNIAPFVLRDEYTLFGEDDMRRKNVLAELAGAIFNRALSGGASPALLVRGVTHSGSTGHLRVFSAHPAEEAALHGLLVAGELVSDPGAYLGVFTQNAAGNKMDSYIRRGVTYDRPSAGLGRLTLTLSNVVPPDAPKLVVARFDHPEVPPPYGETKLLLSIYTGVGQGVRAVRVDGVPTLFSPAVERGHGIARLFVLVDRGRPTHVVAEVTDPGGVLAYHEQPMAVPDREVFRVPFRLT